MQERHKITGAAYVILRKGDQVLLLRRFNTGYEDGNYSFPAGHIEPGEPFTYTAIREAKEEAGIEVRVENLSVAHVMHRKSTDATRSERMDIFFVVEQWTGDPHNTEPDKCDDMQWFSLTALPKNTISYIRHTLDCIDNGIIYSEFGWE